MFVANTPPPPRGHPAPGDRTLFIGLSRGNVEQLMQGKPIHIRRPKHGMVLPDGWDVVVLFGETEEAIVEDFRKAGVQLP